MLYAIIIILVVAWLMGYFVFSVGSLIHVLLLVALIVLVIKLIRGDKIL